MRVPESIAVLGPGTMGQPIAGNLIAAGFRVTDPARDAGGDRPFHSLRRFNA
jgi:3-hydroxyisobutyrate dehydrogenase-like beta-hydroxyacid dehydrogenase